MNQIYLEPLFDEIFAEFSHEYLVETERQTIVDTLSSIPEQIVPEPIPFSADLNTAETTQILDYVLNLVVINNRNAMDKEHYMDMRQFHELVAASPNPTLPSVGLLTAEERNEAVSSYLLDCATITESEQALERQYRYPILSLSDLILLTKTEFPQYIDLTDTITLICDSVVESYTQHLMEEEGILNAEIIIFH